MHCFESEEFHQADFLELRASLASDMVLGTVKS